MRKSLSEAKQAISYFPWSSRLRSTSTQGGWDLLEGQVASTPVIEEQPEDFRVFVPSVYSSGVQLACICWLNIFVKESIHIFQKYIEDHYGRPRGLGPRTMRIGKSRRTITSVLRLSCRHVPKSVYCFLLKAIQNSARDTIFTWQCIQVPKHLY